MTASFAIRPLDRERDMHDVRRIRLQGGRLHASGGHGEMPPTPADAGDGAGSEAEPVLGPARPKVSGRPNTFGALDQSQAVAPLPRFDRVA